MGSKKKSSSSSKKLRYYMKAPYRALISVRDLYVSSLGICAGRVQQGRAIPSSRVPRSQSHGFFNRSRRGGEEDDIAELIRAASQGRLGPMGIRLTDVTTTGVVARRSQSVGIGARPPPLIIDRIDEEAESDVDGSSSSSNRGAAAGAYPRSRSCAVVVGTTATKGRRPRVDTTATTLVAAS